MVDVIPAPPTKPVILTVDDDTVVLESLTRDLRGQHGAAYPVVLGSGKRYFGPVGSQHLLEDPDVVVQGDRVMHLRYRVRPS